MNFKIIRSVLKGYDKIWATAYQLCTQNFSKKVCKNGSQVPATGQNDEKGLY